MVPSLVGEIVDPSRFTGAATLRPGGPDVAALEGRESAAADMRYFIRMVGIARARARRVPLPVLLVPIIAAMVVAMIGDVIGPSLINEHPLWQINLNPRNRWLLLAASQVAAWPFLIVGFIRLVAIDPLFYLLGVQHGDAALRWAERKLGDEAGLVRKIEHWFGRAAPGVVLVAPNGYVCLLAGATGMRLRTFLALNVIGTIGRLTLFLAAGAAFRDQLLDVLEFIQRYQWWLVALSLLIVSFQARKRRMSGALESVGTMQQELETEAGHGTSRAESRHSSSDDAGHDA
jgi:membrane protein DedA with SNARE-associated domain